MSEWWTYRLSSFLLFSPRTYARLHELYNVDIWPLQIVTGALGVTILALLGRRGAGPGRSIALILAACWLWIAVEFHLRRYATINWAATYFAAAFGLQALLLLWMGVLRGRIATASAVPLRRRIGLWLFLFALIAQPALALAAGRAIEVEWFGVAPDPTTVATLGVLLLASDRIPWSAMVVPLAWCAISGAFAIALRLPDAPVMPLAGLLAVVAAIARRRPVPAVPRRSL
jgi:hypothetical protein